jgi:D-alanyl-D-alanine carboxypeptidase
MTHSIPKILFLVFIIISTVVSQINLPDTPEGKIAASYIETFNIGKEKDWRHFFLENISDKSLKDRPIESRIERSLMMQKELKSLEVQKLISSSEKEISLLVKAGNGEILTLTLEFEPTHKLAGIRIMMGEAAPEEIGPPMSKKEVINAIETYIAERVRSDKFSGTVLAARDTNIIFKNAYGFADKRFNTPNKIDTKFNLGSINKFFTRLAIAQLAEAGKLSFDDLIIKHLPDYPNKIIAEKVTIKHLLEMTSGLGDFFGEKYQMVPKDKIRNLKDYLYLFVQDTLLFEPGKNRRYSNAGYIVLGLIIEKISGMDYYTYVRENIFKRAGMENTDSYPMDGITPNLATGYTHPEGDSTNWVSNIYTAPGRGSSAGGGYSTVDDLFKFIQALRNGKLLSPKYSSWMLTGDLPSNDPEIPLRKGDFGIAGGAPGINAAVEFDAESGNLIIVLSNYDPPAAMEVARKLRGLLMRMK